MADSQEYYIRPMMQSDLPDFGTLCADSFLEDEVMGPIWSNAQKTPEAYPLWRSWMLMLMKDVFYRRGVHCWVACHRGQMDEDTSNENPARTEDKIVGASAWIRHGTSKTAQAWQQTNSSWLSALERKLLAYEYDFRPMLGAFGKMYDHKANCRFESALDESVHALAPLIRERWHLSVMVVHPNHHRKGLGSRLMDWGLCHADAEHVPVTLFASDFGRSLYERFNFDVVEWPNKNLEFHQDPEASPWMMRAYDLSRSAL